ncbi:MAG TPA: redoxin domain-containing protein [Pirellulales bacterium]|nr:redoxin domain-containing protein [Pirellulales bacterium]
MSSTKRPQTYLLLCAALGMCGCGESPRSSAPPAAANRSVAPSDPASDPAQPTGEPVDAEPSAAAEGVTADIRDFEGIQELIASKRGKVVVMDCWSTWCEPCMKEFPGLVKLHEEYGAGDVACISLNFNFEGGKNETPDEHKDGVLEFLRGQKATFDNVIARVPSDELYKLLGFETGSLPAILVYGRDGEIDHRFEGPKAKYTAVEKRVAELVGDGQ